MANENEQRERLAFASVGASFGDVEMLQKHGSGAVDLTCPACGARGRRFGNPGEDFRFEGFQPVTAGGLLFIQCECEACKESVTLPHRKA